MNKVFIAQCPSYDETHLTNIFEGIVNTTPSLQALTRGSTVALKANCIIGRRPEAAATTHPLFLKSLAQVLLNNGLNVVIGDSPGGLFNKTFLRSVYETCGLIDTFKHTKVELNYNTAVTAIKNPYGSKLKEFTITRYLLDADYVINVPKLKTHVAMLYSGAIKNWFGIIAGERKFDYHVIMKTPEDFASMLVDLYLVKKPDLNILDAVVGMDHNGPTAGRPREIKVAAASEDGFALDLTALQIVGVNPMMVPVMNASFKRGLLSEKKDDRVLVGTPVAEVATTDFLLPDSIPYTQSLPCASPIIAFLIEAIQPRIAFNYSKCSRCRSCIDVCQAKAIHFRNNKPNILRNTCIRCFCCHELCPVNAVIIRRSPVLKILLTCGLFSKRIQRYIEHFFGIVARSRQSV